MLRSSGAPAFFPVVLALCIVAAQAVQAQPYPQLTSDIAWTGGTSTVADIAAAFASARVGENAQLGSAIPTTLVMPAQAVWDAYSPSQKALYLINAERSARGLLPFEGVSNNIVAIANAYANTLLVNNAFTHTFNNTTPSGRLDGDPAINGCSEQGYTWGPECLAGYVTSGGSIPMPVERSVHMWIYEDLSSAWGHRNTCFAMMNNDFGPATSEGFIGIGVATGGPYSGFGGSWPLATLVVFDFVDPCPTSTLTANQPLAVLAAPHFFLQGAFDAAGDSMANQLRKSGVLSSAFTGTPVPAGAVDSVSIEIRNNSSGAASTLQAFQPAWLMTNGSIRSFTDTTQAYVTFLAPGGSYFIVVHHRNHLPVMSAQALALSGTVTAYDFSTAQSQAWGTNPMVQVLAGVFALFAGDANQTLIITSADANFLFGFMNQPGYLAGDVNLSGIVTAADANMLYGNLNQASQVP